MDNSGFVVGEHGVLVIDAHINGAMAGLIQTAVRQVTNKPILYVVNTNYHGDHTFGNYAFPQETLIVAQQKTAESMRDFEREKQFLLPTVDNDPTVFGDVRLRLPDLVFNEYLELDLGGPGGGALPLRSRQYSRRHRRFRARGPGRLDGQPDPG